MISKNYNADFPDPHEEERNKEVEAKAVYEAKKLEAIEAGFGELIEVDKENKFAAALILLLVNIAKLVKVKTLVTFVVILLFYRMADRGDISSDVVMTVVSAVIGLYFGSQTEKNAKV